MIELFLNVVDAVWYFVFHLGEYVNHTFGKVLVGLVIGLPLLLIGWTIFFQYLVKVFVYWGVIVYHQLHMDKKFDGTQEEFVKHSFRQRNHKIWPIILFWNFAKQPIKMIAWDDLDLIGKIYVKFNLFTFKITRTKALKDFIANGWEIPELDDAGKNHIKPLR